MIYLDYCATTFPGKEVISVIKKASNMYMGNPNSSHNLGLKAKKRIDEATTRIKNMLNLNDHDVIYTSGSSEANNLAIKGVCALKKGKHIITTKLEHSSVIAPIGTLAKNGYEVDFLKLKQDGTIDIDYLKSIIRSDTVLVSIVGVDSELGIKENIKEVKEALKNHPNIHFHVDATQMIGKTNLDDLKYANSFSFSAHKFYGIKGIGCLVKEKNVKLLPQINGGSSTTKYRSGTPCLELIVSIEKALESVLKNSEIKNDYVKSLNNEIKDFLKNYSDIKINSTLKSISNVINFSMQNSKKMVELLNEKKVYLSTKSACSSSDSLSKTVMELYGDEVRANNSIRISISYKTSKKDIKKFKKIFDSCYKILGDKNENN